MTLQSLLGDAITYEEPALAYAIYWASQNGLGLNSDFDTLLSYNIDYSEVDKLKRQDPLGITKVKLYSCKEGSDFHLILANNVIEAKNMLVSKVGRVAGAIHDVSHGMDQILSDTNSTKSEWVRGLKNKTMEFPHYVGLLERG